MNINFTINQFIIILWSVRFKVDSLILWSYLTLIIIIQKSIIIIIIIKFVLTFTLKIIVKYFFIRWYFWFLRKYLAWIIKRNVLILVLIIYLVI